ncbi:ABC transporter ATP-binding protein [Maledivibacter halophilus]|uniref:Peptide/nickel transport system ATP-binding protein n=1 Tax=Maledivibacter halophilus TaxID=36842 RepID=A0A1T5JSE8_9FIRM|nr:ATP-binding cassette domain-containing protein [Maledivibacter halophilus]SKC54303.1 peptide/nickel transport system ATP-binding protein [Maledivibacter halophilus]
MALKGYNLGFYYNKNQWLFRHLNIELFYGEILGISGCSGSGKTSLSKILSNYLKPVEGFVEIDEKPFTKKEVQPVQLIYQHPEKAINPKWKMKDVLEESYDPDDTILERFGIRKEWLSRFPIELSGGELQRFCIVRALHPNTKYIIADEMTTMLDAVTQTVIWRELLDVCRERKIGLAIISHEAALLSRLCDRIISLNQRKSYYSIENRIKNIV